MRVSLIGYPESGRMKTGPAAKLSRGNEEGFAAGRCKSLCCKGEGNGAPLSGYAKKLSRRLRARPSRDSAAALDSARCGAYNLSDANRREFMREERRGLERLASSAREVSCPFLERERAMKIAITTPTGHVGSGVADLLLDSGGDISVKLLGRRPEKLTKFVERGAETSIGSQDDADFLVESTQNVDALLWVTPPSYGSDNFRAFQNRLGRAAATAIRTNRIAGSSTCRRSGPSSFREWGRSAACTTWNDCSTTRPATSRTCGPVPSLKTCSGSWSRSRNGAAFRCRSPAGSDCR